MKDMNEQIKFPKGTKVKVVIPEDERQMDLYEDYKCYVGSKGTVAGIGASLKNVPDTAKIVEMPMNLYIIDIGSSDPVVIPEQMLEREEVD